ncbi:MAG: efflux RND transporter permease subunit, partial [Polyangiales bacterium]
MTRWQAALGFFVENKLVVLILIGLLVGAGVYTSPFDWDTGEMPRDKVPVDAIPDVGENQQIVFTEWPGRSPRDIEDQITYPLTTALLGIPGVKTVRSSSVFGFSSIYVIFEEGIEFYWSRSRVLEKLSALPPGTIPEGVNPQLGPDATALGQVFWYTLEGRDPDGNVVGGWDLHELRSVQDWTVRYALQSVAGVSEVASVGGYVQEYQVDVDPDAMRGQGVTLDQVANAVRKSNLDVGARTIEINRAEYVVRGLGFVEETHDLEQAVVAVHDNKPIRVEDVAAVGLGPAQRRGALDDGGAEVVGGVVATRYGANPMEVIQRVKDEIEEIEPGLPSRTLEDGTESKVTITPFYDRTQLIEETLGTLSTALVQQILVTVIVVLLILRNIRSSLIISSILPLAVLGTFVAMKYTGVDANIMALAGIAIAIGTMVDMGIVFVENIVAHLRDAPPEASRAHVVRDAAAEVAPAVATSVATTVVSFLPVFGLTASAGKLFRPLAFTKTYAMVFALLLSMIVLPALAHLVMGGRWKKRLAKLRGDEPLLSPRVQRILTIATIVLTVVLVGITLAAEWMPLGLGEPLPLQLVFLLLLIGAILLGFAIFQHFYPRLLRWSLRHKALSLILPALITGFGLVAWLGFDTFFGWLPKWVRTSPAVSAVAHAMPGFGREDMPPFDEGSYLYMPTTMPHASIGQALDMMKQMDAAIAQIPEVERAVGKLGRADSPLDPAPVSMYETLVTYKPEYRTKPDGTRVRQWRDHIRSPDDIWKEISEAADVPGITSAPPLMPIKTRIVMLQSGMRAPMGVRVRGPDLQTIQDFALEIEEQLREVRSIDPSTVQADRIVGKPYIEIDIDRGAIARYGLKVEDVQDVIQVALGGKTLTRTVEGRERYPVRVRYMREERKDASALEQVIVPTPTGQQIPLGQLTDIRYVRGPMVIKSEDTFLVSYVTFGAKRDARGEPIEAEAAIVEQAEELLERKEESGELERPAGVSYEFAGTYENIVRTEKRLMVLIPIALALIFLLLYLQFRRVSTTLIIYS